MNTPSPFPVEDNPAALARTTQVSATDQQSFEAATFRLRKALEDAAEGSSVAGVAEARIKLRSLAVKLRDAGFWRSDKQGLRSTVSLLWEADRFVNERALLQPGEDAAQ